MAGVTATQSDPSNRRSPGFTIWLTGMSGAGKSTVAGVVADELRTAGHLVEVLDGDVVRTNLSSELGFSRDDRDTNVRRIGWVCELLARNGVIAVVAAISPYRATRDEVLERLGRVVEVHVTAPLDVLETRDVKGLYRRARAGEIAQFTGIDDAYEPRSILTSRSAATEPRPRATAPPACSNALDPRAIWREPSLMLEWPVLVTSIVIVALIVALVRELWPPALAVLGADIALLLLGVIDGEQAFSGFSSEAPIVVAALLVFARAVDVSGAIQPVVQHLFGTVAATRGILARIVFPLAATSSVINNTTLVAMTVPAVMDVAQRRRLDASRFLLPVSYTAILGGVLTTIGTSTNLTVSGLLAESGLPPLALFELTPVAIPIVVVGCLLLVVAVPLLLPERGMRRAAAGSGRDFTVTMRVEEDGAVAGSTVEAAGLRHLVGVYLVAVERDETVTAPVRPDHRLQGGDLLTFVGRVDRVIDLQRMAGLTWAEAKHINALGSSGHAFHEAVVGADIAARAAPCAASAFARATTRRSWRSTVPTSAWRRSLGMCRSASATRSSCWRSRSSGSGGDTAATSSSSRRSRARSTAHAQARVVLAIGALFIALTGTDVLPILHASLAAVVALLLTGVLNVRQARQAVDLNIVVLIGAAFGLGAAVGSSGLAALIANGLATGLAPLGPVGLLAGVIIATMILTELLSNNAAAALMFPVALAAAATSGLDVRPFVIGVTLGASLSFLSPIGYQTNLMVYALGGYRFTDFTRIGIPLDVELPGAGAPAHPDRLPLLSRELSCSDHHSRAYRPVGGLVDQDEGAGGSIATVAIARAAGRSCAVAADRCR